MSRFALEMSRQPGQRQGTAAEGRSGTNPLWGFVPGAVSRLSRGHCPDAVSPVKSEEAADLRTLMPFADEVVDWLRLQVGRQAADAIVRRGMRGQGGFYVRETGTDGVVREFGSRSADAGLCAVRAPVAEGL